ncbi:MAG TPA: isoprenyl transferase [Pyrinomonadaceae bacterium]|nr:isoprenyl transferase [Pyrinomonadaceae bacterium]
MHKNFAEVVKPNSREAQLLDTIDFARLPQHVAVIMDGNGRWAKQRHQPRIFGHKAGAESVRALLDTSVRLELKSLTLYAFSTENWKRPADEVGALFKMLVHYIRQEIAEVNRQNIRFQAIGRIEGLAPEVQKEIAEAVAITKNNTGTSLNVALNYGSRAEIVDACKNAFKSLLQAGKTIDDLTEDDISENLYTKGLPELDLLIRTSGEFRISNFLLWQLAYSEIYVTPTFFPDFRREGFLEAIVDFQKRDRRFGGTK